MKAGTQRLRDWMDRAKLTQRKAAELLGMHYTFLSQILRGVRSPALATAVRIERITGIPVEAWMPTDVATQEVGVGAKTDNRKLGKA